MLLDELPELLKLHVGAGVPGRDWFEIPGLTVLLELVGACIDRDWLGGLTTLGDIEGLLGIRLIGAGLVRPTDGELLRPMDGGLAGARLTLGGALTLGAGAGAGAGLAAWPAGAGRLAELPPPELELFRSVLPPKTGPQSRIKTEMSARIPIPCRSECCVLSSATRNAERGTRNAERDSIANMICLLSANGSTPVFYSNY